MKSIIYNVTCNMNASIEKKWLEWIKGHIPKVLGTGFFEEARLTRVLLDQEDGSKTYSIQYKAIDRAALDRYLNNHADALRKEGLQAFGDNVLAFRTELEMIDEYRVG